MNQDNPPKQDQPSSENEQDLTNEDAANAQTAQSSESVDASQDTVSSEDEQNGFDWKQYADELEAKLSAAEATVEGQKEAVLRAKAEGENARRRAEQEVDKARKFALEKFAGELLNVGDNLERAVMSADAENEAIKPLLEGVELTQKSFVSTLEKFNITVIDPQGEAFNPEHHQAMSMQESEDVPPNTVIAVMQKGY